jgi:hypothetical protein
MQLSVLAAHHHDRLAAEIGAEIVAGMFNLAVVADINPGRTEDAFQLKFINRRIVIQAAVNASRPDQRNDVFDHIVPHRRSSFVSAGRPAGEGGSS